MVNIQNSGYNPDFVVHPGKTLEEHLETIGMTQVELAQRMERPEKTISEIVNGISSITPDTAIQLERTLGIPATFWNNLQSNYDQHKARIDARLKAEGEFECLKKYPYALMVKLGWIKDSSDNFERVTTLLTYLGVNSLSAVGNVYQPAFRIYTKKSISRESLVSWLRKGEQDGNSMKTEIYDERKLKQIIGDFRRYTNLPTSEFATELVNKLAECGVALVFTHDLPRTYVCGATRWLNPQKALIQLSLRGHFADIMWFTLYHELGHIILHGKREKFIDMDSYQSTTDPQESEANRFAANCLIPEEQYNIFIRKGVFDYLSIKTFATQLGIHVGIVVGRLQHEGLVPFNKLNELKDRYIITETADEESS